MTDRRIPGLDLLRALAIGGVVLAHGLLFVLPHHPRLGALLHLGSLGVDLFFVLSGFLIGGILWRAGDRLRHGRALAGFWGRRWLRTLPNYFLFLGVNVALAVWIFRDPLAWRADVLPTAFFVRNLAWPAGTFFPESWTLAAEEWFYLLLPLALALGLRGTRLRFPAAMWTVTAAMLLAPLVARAAMAPAAEWDAGVRRVALLRLDSIAWGVAAAGVAATAPALWRRLRWPGLGAGIVLVAWCYTRFYAWNLELEPAARIWLFDAIGLGFALWLPAAAATSTLGSDTIAAVVRSIARWSYSMYLCNFSLCKLLLAFGGGAILASPALAWQFFAAFLLFTTILSAVVFHLFEQPITRSRERWPLLRESR